MQPDMVRRLQQLQRQAAQLDQLAKDLAAAAPQWSQGTDTTGSVRITLDADGIPTTIRIHNDWSRSLDADSLGQAVVDANTDALRGAMHAWTDRLDSNGWWMRRADLDHAPDDQAGLITAHPADLPSGSEREPTELVESVMTALHAAQKQLPAPADVVTGSDAGGQVTITLGAGGLTGCEIDAGWASRHDGSTISAALSTALRQAVAHRVPLPRDAGMDPLLGDALATLASLTRQMEQGGNR
jgi:DNA-binding protein YbaB